MSYYWSIKAGDLVSVFLTPNPQDSFNGTVRHYPQSQGEAWVIEERDGTISYVQTYFRIVKLGGSKEESNGKA